MNKKGFVLVESIIMFLVLMVALGFVYNTVNSVLVRQKQTLFYDDVAVMYRAYYVKEAVLKYTNFDTSGNISNFLTIPTVRLGAIIGTDISNFAPGFFKSGANTVADFNRIVEVFNLEQIFITSGQNMAELKNCSRNINEASERCKNTFMDEELRSYIRTISTAGMDNDQYYLILTFRTAKDGSPCTSTSCFNYHAWVRLL